MRIKGEFTSWHWMWLGYLMTIAGASRISLAAAIIAAGIGLMIMGIVDAVMEKVL